MGRDREVGCQQVAVRSKVKKRVANSYEVNMHSRHSKRERLRQK